MVEYNRHELNPFTFFVDDMVVGHLSREAVEFFPALQEYAQKGRTRE